MNIVNRTAIAAVFATYPQPIRDKLVRLHGLILETATETDGVGRLEETLKWGEPAYVTLGGSTVRLGWKKSNPAQYAMYFHCKTTLVDTFKELYRNDFTFQGNRAILFDEDTKIPIDELKHCVSLALTYHSRKHLPMLGVRQNTASINT